MSRKSVIVNGLSTISRSVGSESYRYNPNGVLAGMADYKPPTTHTPNVADGTKSLEFDPKTCEVNDWCPIYEIGKTESGGSVYFCSITSSISNVHEYVNLMEKLYTAKNNDIIELNIDSPGGYICSATQICTAIRACKGHVMTHASGMCASAGSLIWSVGHTVSVGDQANFMWHMSSHFDWGNSLKVFNEAEFQINYVRDSLLNISLQRGFITEEEVAKICTNPNEAVWVSAIEMRNRIEANNTST